MEPKYRMTREGNIFVAKRNIVDYIWKSARLEGVNVTFPETYAIYEQARLKDIDVDTVVTIINLKHAWNLLLGTIGRPLDLEYICALHAEVARGEAVAWGALRTGRVGISGTDYLPPIPDAKKVRGEVTKILSISSPTERAITLMLWGMKSQLFWDGNKRTSMLAANKIMIENGCGIISVPTEHIQGFNAALTDYYTNDTFDFVSGFVYANCIDGIDFEPETEETPHDPEDDGDDWEPER
jgi:Fic family protein